MSAIALRKRWLTLRRARRRSLAVRCACAAAPRVPFTSDAHPASMLCLGAPHVTGARSEAAWRHGGLRAALPAIPMLHILIRPGRPGQAALGGAPGRHLRGDLRERGQPQLPAVVGAPGEEEAVGGQRRAVRVARCQCCHLRRAAAPSPSLRLAAMGASHSTSKHMLVYPGLLIATLPPS